MALKCDMVQQEGCGASAAVLVDAPDRYACLNVQFLLLCSQFVVNMLVHASRCHSGVSSTDYSKLCKVTDVSAPVLSIMTNISVMILVLWRGW